MIVNMIAIRNKGFYLIFFQFGPQNVFV